MDQSWTHSNAESTLMQNRCRTFKPSLRAAFFAIMIRNLILLTLLFALGSCSLQFDSQYGIRFEPAKIEADASRAQPRSADEWASSAPTYSAPETAPDAWSTPNESFIEMDFLASESQAEPLPAIESWTESVVAEQVVNVESEHARVAAAPWPKKKPERSMTVAWILWAIPAVLVLFAAGGLLLNFGAHWYYLGYHRKGMAKTIIWAITLAVFSVVVFLTGVLGMNLLASLVALFLLVPLAVIQIIGLVKDFFALQKIANKMARSRNQRIV